MPIKRILMVAAAAVAAVCGWQAIVGPTVSAEPATVVPAPAVDTAATGASGPQTVVLAGGCFWGVQAVFQHTKGVIKAVSGYAGGSKETAEYETVSTGTTGHAESVAVTFDPSVVQLWDDPADLFLGCARSNRAQPSGSR